MKNLKIILLLILFNNLFAQSTEQKYPFAEEIFQTKYHQMSFEKFKGEIKMIDKHTFRFDEKILQIDQIDEENKLIFLNGIFYPNIITGNAVAQIKSKAEINSLTSQQRIIYNIIRTDSLYISNFNEIKYLNPDYRTKRFVFWLFKKGTMNPTEYYLELTNEEATKSTSIEDFIKNAVLSFFYKGSLII
jgi:hypothetical protein